MACARVDDAVALADAGVARVVMGSAALADPALVEQVATRVPVAVGLDHRGGRAGGARVDAGGRAARSTRRSTASRRRPRSSSPTSTATACSADPTSTGCGAAVAATDATGDRQRRCRIARRLAALAAIPGLHGIITGRALYEGRFTVAEAVEVLR